MDSQLQDINQLFIDLGLSDLSEEEKVVLEDRIMDLLEDRVFIRIIDALNEEQKASVEKMETEDFWNALPSFGIDVDALSLEEGIKLRQELLSNMSYLRGYLDSVREKEEKTALADDKTVEKTVNDEKRIDGEIFYTSF